jgi:hypothetical protein
MKTVSYGSFSFNYVDAPPDATPIKARADFRYGDGKWELNEFGYRSAMNYQSVVVYKEPPKEHPYPLLDILLFRQSY